MDAYQIQAIALAALRSVKPDAILKSSIYSLSSQPEDENLRPRVRQDSFQADVVMSREKFFAFRERCNANGVWIKAWFEPFGATENFVYYISATEMRT